jgi:hypothetical protein
MKREYWLALAIAGFLTMLPLGWLALALILFVPGLAVFLLLKEKFDLVELIACSFTLSILLFPLATVIGSVFALHLGPMLLGFTTIGIALYKYSKSATVEVERKGWHVLAIALVILIIVLYITLKTFALTDAGLTVGTTHASDLNFHLSIAQHYILSPQIPPQDPYLPGYDIVYNWLMHVELGELGILTGVDLFVILKIIVPIVSALIFLDAYLLARLIFKSDRQSLAAALIYVTASGLSWAYLAFQYFIQNIQYPDVFKILVYEWPGIMTLKYDPTVLYFFLPQTQTFGLMAMAFGFYMYILTVRTKSVLYGIVTGLVLAALMLFHMITAFPVFLALGIYFLYLLYKERRLSTLVAAIPLAIAAIAGIFQLSLLEAGLSSQVVLGHNPDVVLTLVFSLGLLVPFALYGMYLFRKNDEAWLLILFAAINVILINVVELPATVNTYRFFVFLALPLSLFAGLVIARWLSSKKAVLIAVAAVGFYDQALYTHATSAEYDALVWIKSNTPTNSVIFEAPGPFPRVPVVTGRESAYAGEIYTTQYHNVDRQAEMYGLMSVTNSSSLYQSLAADSVNYVFLGSSESRQPFVQALADPAYFTPVYDKNDVKVYQVAGVTPPQEVQHMDISFLNWLSFAAAFLYLLFIPGLNVIRTMGWDGRYTTIERILIAFGISVSILVIVSTLLALPFSIGLNFYTLVILETLVIVATSREVVAPVLKMVKK